VPSVCTLRSRAMHFLVGLGILAGLAWFAFGADAARTIVGVALMAVAAFCGFILFIAAVDIRRQSVEIEQPAAEQIRAAIRTCLAQRWDYDAQIECEQAAASDRRLGVAPTEISRMVEDAAADNQGAALADNRRDRDFPALTNADVKAAIHRTSEGIRVNAVRKCMEKHNWGSSARSECDK
jgi:hypothetical protein